MLCFRVPPPMDQWLINMESRREGSFFGMSTVCGAEEATKKTKLGTELKQTHQAERLSCKKRDKMEGRDMGYCCRKRARKATVDLNLTWTKHTCTCLHVAPLVVCFLVLFRRLNYFQFAVVGGFHSWPRFVTQINKRVCAIVRALWNFSGHMLSFLFLSCLAHR